MGFVCHVIDVRQVSIQVTLGIGCFKLLGSQIIMGTEVVRPCM